MEPGDLQGWITNVSFEELNCSPPGIILKILTMTMTAQLHPDTEIVVLCNLSLITVGF